MSTSSDELAALEAHARAATDETIAEQGKIAAAALERFNEEHPPDLDAETAAALVATLREIEHLAWDGIASCATHGAGVALGRIFELCAGARRALGIDDKP